MTLAEELGLINGQRVLWTSDLNSIRNVHGRIEEILVFIASSDGFDCVRIDEAPIEESLGHRISQAIVSNPHINEIGIIPTLGAAMQDVLSWIAVWSTLERMASLQKVCIYAIEFEAASTPVLDWDMNVAAGASSNVRSE
jgi:hypothetical protein